MLKPERKRKVKGYAIQVWRQTISCKEGQTNTGQGNEKGMLSGYIKRRFFQHTPFQLISGKLKKDKRCVADFRHKY